MDQALVEANRLQELYADSSHVHFQLAKILLATGKPEESAAMGTAVSSGAPSERNGVAGGSLGGAGTDR